MRDMRRQLAAGQAYAASSPISFELPVTAVYKSINLSLEYGSNTGVGVTLTTPFERCPWTNIKRIDLVADGRDVIKSYDGGSLLDINQFDYGAYPPSQIVDQVASTDNGTAAYPLWHNLQIDLGLPGFEKEFNRVSGQFSGGPSLTLLDGRKLSSLELRVTFGAGHADLFATVVGAPTFTRFNITPWGHELLDMDRETSFPLNVESETATAFPTTTATDRGFKLNVGNAYRRLLISTVDQNGRNPVNRLGTILLQENGTFNRRRWDAGNLAASMARLAIQEGLDPANPATLVRAIPRMIPVVETAQGKNGGNRRGVYMLDIAEDNRVGSLLDTRGFSSLEALLSWDGANTTDLIRITSNFLVPNVR